MKKLLASTLVWMLMGLLSFSIAPPPPKPPPMEEKRDLLMEMRFSKSLLALREKDDKKTRTMLWAMAKEYILAMEQLKPAYKQWYKGLSMEERMQLVKRMNEKKWISTMQEIQFDKHILDRFMKNPGLKREYDHIQFLCDKAAEMELLDE